MRNESEILHQLQNWAESQEQVRAMVLTSSRANPYAFTDLFSDYDIELFVNDLQPFANSDRWLEAFGSILVCWPAKPTVTDNWITRLVIFDDGLRIDFQISTTDSLASFSAPELPPEYDIGYKILLDKDYLIQNPTSPTYTKFLPQTPGREEYETLAHDFWWDITYVAKSLWRDELFYAKYGLDNEIRFSYLQKMLEWYIGIRSDWKVNPNKYGRWFKRYLDAETWAELETTFAGANIEENWAALFNTVNLFRRLALAVGDRLGYEYPADLDRRVTEYLLKIKNLDPSSWQKVPTQ